MPREFDDDSEWDEGDSDESPDDDVDDDDDSEPTIPCPYCRREILEDAERCPYCENYISAEDRPSAVKPLWIVIGAVACLLAVCWWLVV